MCLIGMVDENGEPVGTEELNEIEDKMVQQKQLKQLSGVAKAQLARLLMVALLRPSDGVRTEEEEEISSYEWRWIGILLILGWALGMAIWQTWKTIMRRISDGSLGQKNREEKGDETQKDWKGYAQKLKSEHEHMMKLCRKTESESEELRQKCSTLEYENLVMEYKVSGLQKLLEDVEMKARGEGARIKDARVCIYPHGKVFHVQGSPCQWAQKSSWYGCCQTCAQWYEGSMSEVPRSSVIP